MDYALKDNAYVKEISMVLIVPSENARMIAINMENVIN